MDKTKKNAILLNPLATKYCNLITQKEAVMAAGFDGFEAFTSSCRDYLDAGFTEQELSDLLKNVYMGGCGCICDIERQGPDLDVLLEEMREAVRFASICGAGGVQIITGPLDYRAVEEFKKTGNTSRYAGTLGYSESDQMKIAASNAAKLADIAAEKEITLYLEPLCWTPIGKVSQGLELIDRAERDNLKVIIDFFHCTITGETPDEIAKIDKELIYGIHICDTLMHKSGVPNEVELRNVQTGKGIVPIREWVSAVKSTGYDMWWSGELFHRKLQQDNPFVIANTMYEILSGFVNG
jgi:sugar phosphate isomerase/epimerase